MEKTGFGVNFEAYFLGPKGENYEFYSKLLKEILENHVFWRQAFHPNAPDFISEEDKARKDFKEAQARIEGALLRLCELLKKNQPFFSPRYIGHMNWETMAAPLIAYFAAALYNPNNVAKAGSTGTSDLELQVGQDLLELFGFDLQKGWGHICTGGTIANMEALWIARNMKVIPLVANQMLQRYGIQDGRFKINGRMIDIRGLADSELLSCFNPLEILDLKDGVLERIKDAGRKAEELDDEFDSLSMQGQGLLWGGKKIDPGVVLMPQTKHYSLKKAMDLIGLGRSSIRYVPVDKHFRMDMQKLEQEVFKEAQQRPILAVIGVLGSTEESSVDAIDRIVAIREKLKQEKSMGFHIHVDAAFGGYVRSLFLDEHGHFMNKQELHKKLENFGIIGDKKKERAYASWPHEEVFKAYRALPQVDTIAVDPHKLGYIIYPAGGFTMRDKRMREVIQTYAPYVFERPTPGTLDELIGSYILEGSKPGAAAAAVWTAHRIMPLNITGYGKLIGETIDGAQALYYSLEHADPFEVTGHIKVKVVPVIKPDINIVNYVFNFDGNRNLEKMNELTKFIGEKILGPLPEGNQLMLEKTFIVSTTDFTKEEYQDSPLPFLRRIGFSETEWKSIKEVKIIRSVVMSPYLTPDYVDANYVDRFIEYLKQEIRKKAPEILEIYNTGKPAGEADTR